MLKSKVLLFVGAMLFGVAGFILSWSVWTLITDHERLNQIWSLELQRAQQAQQQQRSLAPGK